MPTYIGFSTILANYPRSTNATTGNQGGPGNLVRPISYGNKFKLVDEQLVLRDFLNALNIPLGQKVGQPQYGTTLWSFVFEPNTADVQYQLENEIKRVVSLDPRIQLGYVKAFPQANGILLEVQMAVNPFNDPAVLSIFFNPANNTAVLQ
jgi:phage baseplate assembly protein W